MTVNSIQQSIIQEGYDAHIPQAKKDDPTEKMKGFLSLFIQQIKNRGFDDKPEDIFEKYAQMTSVEQSLKLGKQMAEMAQQMSSLVAMQLPAMIGQTVETPMNHGELKEGEATFVYKLDKPSIQTHVHVLDDMDNVVRSMDGSLEVGTHTLDWDGFTNDGFRLSDGPFKVKVEAYDHEGKLIKTPQVLQERIESVDIKQRKVVVGGRLIDPTEINQMSKLLSQS